VLECYLADMEGDKHLISSAKLKMSRPDNEDKDEKNDDENVSRKKMKPTPEDSNALQLECSVCLENPSESNQVIDHQCGSCTKDAWKICEECNEKLLSRTCPFCRLDYAPVMLYAVPGRFNDQFRTCSMQSSCRCASCYSTSGLPFSRLKDSTLSVHERTLLLYKFGIVKTIIHRSNVAIWSQKYGTMYFSFPMEVSNDNASYSHFTASIPMYEDRIRNDQFRFDNKVWDEIENAAENEGVDDTEEEVDQGGVVEEDGVVDGSAVDGTDLDPANYPFLIEAPSTAVQIDDHAVDATGAPSTELLDGGPAAEESLQAPVQRGFKTSADAFFWVMSFTRHPHHKLFTVMNEEEWYEALDPDHSLDTMETLQALSGIIAPPSEVE